MRGAKPLQSIHLPMLGRRYWLLISTASIFGANLGDFVSRDLHGGHWRGLLPLLAILVGLLAAERRSIRPTDLFYWLGIIVVRTAATNLADLITHDGKLPYAWAVGGLAILLAAIVATVIRRTEADRLPRIDERYWLAMLLAGTLGTAIGDGTADELGLGLLAGSAVLGAVTAVLFGLRAVVANAATYWITVTAVRSAGTTLGDLAAHTVGLEWSTLATFLVFAAAYAWLPSQASMRATPGLTAP